MMDLRAFIRGRVPWEDLERVAQEIRRRYDQDSIRLEYLQTDNWLSTPCVVDEKWFVKIISPQNALVHSIFTGARNLGAFSSGTKGFFEAFDNPAEMAAHEFEAMRRLRAIGVNAPEPLETFEVNGFAVLVIEYLPNFRTLTDAESEEVRRRAPELFRALSKMHAEHLAHGDLRGENVLIYDSELYFIDVTKVRAEAIESATAYDVASAIATLSPVIGARSAVDAAENEYSTEQLLQAREFIDIVSIRPDLDIDAGQVKGEIDKRASREAWR